MSSVAPIITGSFLTHGDISDRKSFHDLTKSQNYGAFQATFPNVAGGVEFTAVVNATEYPDVVSIGSLQDISVDLGEALTRYAEFLVALSPTVRSIMVAVHSLGGQFSDFDRTWFPADRPASSCCGSSCQGSGCGS